MKLKITYILEESKKNKLINNIQKSLIDYLSKTNHNIIIVEFENFNKNMSNYINNKSDIFIFFGIYSNFLKKNTHHKKIIYDIQKKYNKGILFLELGFIKRKQYFSFGWNSNVGFGYYHNNNMPSDRLKKLNIKLKPNIINKNGYILLCGQIPHDTQLQHYGSKKYIIKLQNIVNEIKKYSNKKIVFRSHPKIKGRGLIKLNSVIYSKNDNINDDFKNAFVVIGINSNSLLEAMIYGLPVFVLDHGSLIYDIANNDLSQIENPKFPNDKIKYQKFYDIAYTQWNLKELKNGEAFNHIINGYKASLSQRYKAYNMECFN